MQNLSRYLVLGVDFLQKHHIVLIWSDKSKGLLTQGIKAIVGIIPMCKESPHILTRTKQDIPHRTLAIIDANMELKD